MSSHAGGARGGRFEAAGAAGADDGGEAGARAFAEGGAETSSDGGAQAVAEGGAGGVELGAGMAITGTVVDIWRRPVSGCPVALGAATTVTGSHGEFRFESVTPPYDIAFAVDGVPNTSLATELWLYTGLTRADPTLQFDRVLVNHQTDLYIERTNIPTAGAGSGSAQVGLGMSFAAPGLELDASGLTPNGGFAIGNYWSGASSLTGSVHSLAWLSPSGDTQGLDLEFLSYREQPFTLIDDPSLGAPSPRVTLDFSPNDVPSETYSVKIPGADPVAGIVLSSAVVFDSNAAIWLTRRKNPEATSEVPMPLLRGANALFAASRHGPQPGRLGQSYEIVHRVADSSASVTELALPSPRTLTAPDDEALDVTALTRFEWSEDASVSVLHIACETSPLDVHVVTAASSATWPLVSLPDSAFPSGSQCSWSVETHGSFAATDDAAGPNGFVDACDHLDYCDDAPLFDDGSWTRSSPRAFTTALGPPRP